MFPRIVATDLDGTIVRRDGTISPRTIGCLRELQSRGVQVVFATGRPPRWLYPAVRATGVDSRAICSNGAQIFDPRTSEVVAEETLDTSVSLEIARDMRATFEDARFAVEVGLDFGHEPGFAPGWDPPDGSQVASVEALLSRPVVKLMVRSPKTDPDQLLHQAYDIVGTRATVTRSIGISLVEISRRGINKATGLAFLADQLEVAPDQVLAFGDQTNDAPMFEWAGRSVAVGNAHQDAKDKADEVTLDVEDDGVAVVLERLFLEGN